MGKHTEGPLEVYEGPQDKPELTVQHVGKGGQVVTVADFLQREIPPKERKANAHLFAAAPDMLRALDHAFDHSCHRSEGRCKWTARDQKAHDVIKAAIDKARKGG